MEKDAILLPHLRDPLEGGPEHVASKASASTGTKGAAKGLYIVTFSEVASKPRRVSDPNGILRDFSSVPSSRETEAHGQVIDRQGRKISLRGGGNKEGGKCHNRRSRPSRFLSMKEKAEKLNSRTRSPHLGALWGEKHQVKKTRPIRYGKVKGST